MQPGLSVRVTNHNPFPIAERYDGVPVDIPANGKVVIDLDAAAHFFGFPIDEHGAVSEIAPDLEYIKRRWGWNTPTFGVPLSPEGKPVLNQALAQKNAAAALANIKIEAVQFRMVEEKPDDSLPAPREHAANADAPEDPERARRAKSKATAHLTRARRGRRRQPRPEPELERTPETEPAGEAA